MTAAIAECHLGVVIVTAASTVPTTRENLEAFLADGPTDLSGTSARRLSSATGSIRFAP